MSNEVKLSEGRMDELENKAKYFKSPSLEDVELDEEELADPDSIEMEQGAAFKKAVLEKLGFNLGIYPDKSLMLLHLQQNSTLTRLGTVKFGKSIRIKRDTLRVGGQFIQNPMEDYLEKDNVYLDENLSIAKDDSGRIQGYFQSTHLKAANITPRHLYFKIAENLLPTKKRQKHFDLGEALHACLMEPTRFGRYVAAPIDPQNTHDGMDKHIEFWKGKLLDVMVAEENGTVDGKINYEEYLKALRTEMELYTYNQILDFIHEVKLVLLAERDRLKEGHTFNHCLQQILDLYEQTFNGQEIAFADKAGEDPFKVVVKELGLKKNESLGESKKLPFDSFPKETLLNSLIHVCADYISVNQEKGSNEFFKNLEQKKNYLETISLRTGLESVSENDFLIIKALESNAKYYGNGIIYKLAKHAHRECSAYLDDYDGLPLKVRPDMIQFEENIGVNAVISVKSTSSPNIEKFFYDTAKYQYELSEGMYQEVLSRVTGREFRSTITIMYQTVEPYGVAVFWWKPEDLELGRHKFLQAHQTLKETIEKDIWPGYDIYAEEGDFGIIDFQLPWWAAKGLEERNQEGLGAFHPTGDIE